MRYGLSLRALAGPVKVDIDLLLSRAECSHDMSGRYEDVDAPSPMTTKITTRIDYDDEYSVSSFCG
eukprot:scaffold12796_cov67-Skeletonema_dohrnii-CCMP3373.AAC.3